MSIYEIIAVGSPFDDFDGDMLKLVPGVTSCAYFAEAQKAEVYTYGSLDRTGKMLAHPATWNGVGARFWLHPPIHARDKHGWVHFDGGLTTDDRCVRVSVVNAVRDAWTHHYRASLSGELWFRPFQQMLNLLYHARGQAEHMNIPARADLERAALSWAERALFKALRMAGVIPTGEAV